MKRWRFAAALAVLLILASVSVRLPRTLHVTDTAHAPTTPSYVVYTYWGARLNPVHSATYRAGGLVLARGDSSGRIVIPLAVHLHRPFPIETHPKLMVEVLYVPAMHNAAERFNEDDRAVVADLSADPEQWEGTLRNLASIIPRIASQPDVRTLRTRDPAAAALIRELMAHFRHEYELFLERYESVERVRPEMPFSVRSSSAEEQRQWIEFIDAQIAREPHWGILIRRLFGDDVKRFGEWETELR
jgi:hypothetical protein